MFNNSLVDLLIFSALVALVYIVLSEIRARRERLNIFKRGNLPALEVKNLLLGNLTDTISHPKNIFIIDQYHRKFGWKSFGTFYGPYPWVFTCDPELLHRLFVQESQRFVNLNAYHLPYAAEVDRSLPQLRDDEWRVLRRALNPTFSMKQMKSDNVLRDVEELTHKIIKEVVEAKRVEELTTDGDSQGRIVNLLYLARRYSLSVFYRVAYGGGKQQDLSPEAIDEMLDIVEKSSGQVTNSLFVQACIVLGDWSKSFFRLLLPFSQVGPSIKAINKLLNESVENRRQMSRQEVERNRKMIDTILETVKRHNMDDDVLNANLFLFFLAGYDTTATSIAILLWLLARHPTKQDKLRATLIAEGDASEYLTWCSMESLRLYPSVPTGIGRELSEDYHYNGMTFFKGTSVVGSTYTMHRLEEYWGEDAAEFRPERHARPIKHPFQYLPFGGGPRICPGMNLSLTEIRSIITRIILNYKLVDLANQTPKELELTSPNLFQLIVHGEIPVGFEPIN